MTKKLHFCTLFDSCYLSRGLALYDSLIENCDNFHLYIFAFDEMTNCHLRKLNLSYVTVISLQEFEDEELLAIKNTRSRGEYCWTCTPSVIRYVLNRYSPDHCTYLDADIFFFSDPRSVIEKFLNSKFSVLITPHNYTSIYDQTKTSGIYCVQFMPFKNNEDGLKILEWWRDKCLEWCFMRLEDGKFGDQMYLDAWPEMFPQVYVENDRGIGVAPWNVNQLTLTKGIVAESKKDKQDFKIVFYHFHGLRIHTFDDVFLGNYYVPRKVKNIIYSTYIDRLYKVDQSYGLHSLDVNAHSKKEKLPPIIILKSQLKKIIDLIQITIGL